MIIGPLQFGAHAQQEVDSRRPGSPDPYVDRVLCAPVFWDRVGSTLLSSQHGHYSSSNQHVPQNGCRPGAQRYAK